MDARGAKFIGTVNTVIRPLEAMSRNRSPGSLALMTVALLADQCVPSRCYRVSPASGSTLKSDDKPFTIRPVRLPY